MPDPSISDGKPAVRQRGNRIGFWFFRTALRLFGRRGAYGLLHLVCPYYLLFDRQAVRASTAYVRRRFPAYGALRRQLAVYRLFVSQGRSLIDRQHLLAGGQFDTTLHGEERISNLLEDRSRGFVLLTSHMGNWQAATSILRAWNRPVCLLMRPEDNPAVRESLQVGASGDMIRTLSPDSFLGGVVELMNLLRQGYIVSIMGDRTYGHTSVTVPFFGDNARFPCGAFSIAAAAGCPVVVLLSAKESARAYRVDIAGTFMPAYLPGVNKREQLRQWVAEFAGILERYAEAYPLQFFLFQDIWSPASEEEAG